MDWNEVLLQRIREKQAIIGVVGLGYVGLPLLVSFARAGFPVLGMDLDAAKIDLLRSGHSCLADLPADEIKALLGRGAVFSTDYAVLESADAVLICVPTPLNKTRDPDVQFLIQAGTGIARHLRKGMIVALESTTYPGTTDELLRPLLEESGLQAGRDFFLVFSPERIDPGRTDLTLDEIPKVVGGLSPQCLVLAQELYGQIIQTVVPVSSTQSAEMVKLLENTFRAVNIALVNEIAIMCDKLGIDVWEVVEAAATKPYGFMKFVPGPGVGGHCVPLDPHYLSWKLKTLDYNARFVQLAGEINSAMPKYWVDKVQDALNQAGQAVKGSTVLLIGVAYKPGVSDFRESPALDIIELLEERGARVLYYDPFVTELRADGIRLEGEPDLNAAVDSSDCVLIVTDHPGIDWEAVASRARLLVDSRFVLKRQKS